MSRDLSIIAALPPLPVMEPAVTVEAIAEKESALAASALLGKVDNRAENDAVTEARKRIKGLAGDFDRARKRITDPLVEMQRLFIRTVEPHIDELKREDGRLELLQTEFALAEKRRVREEQEAQQRELQRIEQERQAELQRIQQEQDRIEREAREAREAAERAEREATTKKQREAAAKAAQEAEAKRKEAEASAVFAKRQTQLVNDRAELDARIESKPVEMTRSRGQTTTEGWTIKSINDFQLMKARPDLVRKIEWDLLALKQALTENDGKLPGVVAEKDLKISTRGNARPTIDV